MTIPAAEFLNTGLEVDAVLTTASGTSNIKAHFLSEYEAAGQEIQFESGGLQAHVLTDDVSGAAHGDKLTIAGVDYYVKEIHNDGTGITILILSLEK